jgi:hypothetical protein
MQRQPRLSRSEVVARLRALAAQHGGAVSPRMLVTHDGAAARSLRIHFPSFAMACRAARVEVAQPPPRSGLRRSARAVWSKGRVVDALQRLDAEGAPTGWAELMQRGQGALVSAAAAHAGGLQQARAEAGVAPPERRPPVPRWDHAAIVAAIREQARTGQPLASSRAPQRLVAAARWHFGSWEAALAAAKVDPDAVRLRRAPVTRDGILERIRGLARAGTAVRASTLKAVVKLDTVRKLFGSIEAAVREAGIAPVMTHGNLKWTRERVIAELKARAARGETRLTRGLQRAVQLYFGGAHAAREAAGLAPLVRIAWTKPSLVKELQRRARRGDRGRALWSACIRLFGSVAVARAAAGLPAAGRAGMASWARRALLAELRRRLETRQPLGRGLTAGLRREFGSLEAARAAARRGRRGSGAAAGRTGRSGVRRGPRVEGRMELIERLQAWHAAGGGPPDPELVRACRLRFGSVVRACAAANVPVMATPWTRRRVRKALREPGVDLTDPELVAACLYHFGSVTAARAAVARGQGQRQWTKATVIAELQARSRRGLKGVGRLLRDPAVRLFGSTEAALAAAAQAMPRSRLSHVR